MADKLKGVAVEEVEHIKELTKDAVKSRTYLYPPRGIWYFISHKALWSPFMSKLTPTLTLSLGVTTFMLTFAYLPQAAVLAFTSGPVAAVTAALLTLSESYSIVNMLSRSFLIEDALFATFDQTLELQGCRELVVRGRLIHVEGDRVNRLSKKIAGPFARYMPKAIMEHLFYLPLNLIPVVGPLIYIILQGKNNGPGAHGRYFQLKGWSNSQREAHIERNRAGYTSFGIASFLLEMIPFASLIFGFTNQVGAALWAADMEKQAGTAPNLREQAEKAE